MKRVSGERREEREEIEWEGGEERICGNSEAGITRSEGMSSEWARRRREMMGKEWKWGV